MLGRVPIRGGRDRAPLPCQPCPHGSACCRFGTSLTDSEARHIAAIHGASSVTDTSGEWRTATHAKGCVFLSDNRCSIHGAAYYPATCRAFPWRDRDGGAYEGDLSICPEFA